MNFDTQKQLLDRERERLEKELESVARPKPTQPGTQGTALPVTRDASNDILHGDMEEEADMNEEFEVNVAEMQALEERLHEVTRALIRIADGSYGTCGVCKKPISEDRLMANPAAEYDIEHQPA